MDVRCTKCGIEYEFDDAKVTAAGVTVKCTSCGHVFKVKRDEPAFPSPPSTGPFAADGEWMVRQQGGTIYRFKELTTLQKWIVERKVSRDDEISKTGRTWKRLGEIAELASFFQVVDAANAALQASLVNVQPAMSAEPPVLAGPATRPGMPAIQVVQTDPGLGAQLLPQPTSQPTPQTNAGFPIGSAVMTNAPGAMSALATPVRAPPPSSKAAADAFDALDDDDPVLAWQRSKRRRLLAATALLVIAAVAAVGWTFRTRLHELWPGAGEAALAPAAVGAAHSALRADRAPARAAARAPIDAAAAVPGAPVAALAWQARFDIADAAEQRELGRLHTALAALGGPDAAKHEAAAREAQAAADTALAHAYRVVGDVRTRAPKLPEGHLAAAAYQLEKGGFAEVTGDLEAARQAASPEELPGIDAEIAVQQALADARAALAVPDPVALLAAAERVPQSDDGRLRDVRASLHVQALARRHLSQAPGAAPIAAPEIAAARALVASLPEPEERVRLLGALLDAVAAPAAAETDADAGVLLAADAGVAPAADAGADAASGASGASDSYDVVMQKAERARVNGKSKLAAELFAKATKQKPSAPRPWLGLGWAAMDLGRNSEALRAFKRAVELSPDIGDAHFGLAEAYRYTGQSAQAVAEYQEFLRIDPKSRDAEVARRAIDSLKE